MSRWSKLFQDKVRPEFRDRLFTEANKELEKIATEHRILKWRSIWPWAGAFSSLCIAGLIWLRTSRDADTQFKTVQIADESDFNAELAEFVAGNEDVDLEFFDDLEMLEELDELDKESNG